MRKSFTCFVTVSDIVYSNTFKSTGSTLVAFPYFLMRNGLGLDQPLFNIVCRIFVIGR